MEEVPNVPVVPEPDVPAPPVKRYYGRKKGNESDSELSVDSDKSDDSEDYKSRLYQIIIN